MKGTLKKFDPRLGFGFVRADDGREVFLHHTEIVDGTRLRPGLRLEFDVEPSPNSRRGSIATNVCATGRDTRLEQPEFGTRRGWLRKFDPERGFGFVKPEDGGRSLFFHVTHSLLGDEKAVAGGLPVEFETGYGPEGRPEAINVRRIAPDNQIKE